MPEAAIGISVLTGDGMDRLLDRLTQAARGMTESAGPPPLTSCPSPRCIAACCRPVGRRAGSRTAGASRRGLACGTAVDRPDHRCGGGRGTSWIPSLPGSVSANRVDLGCARLPERGPSPGSAFAASTSPAAREIKRRLRHLCQRTGMILQFLGLAVISVGRISLSFSSTSPGSPSAKVAPTAAIDCSRIATRAVGNWSASSLNGSAPGRSSVSTRMARYACPASGTESKAQLGRSGHVLPDCVADIGPYAVYVDVQLVLRPAIDRIDGQRQGVVGQRSVRQQPAPDCGIATRSANSLERRGPGWPDPQSR